MAGRTRRSPVVGDPLPGMFDAEEPQPEADPVEVAKQIVLKQLGHSPKTRHQLAQVLARRNVPTSAAEAALDRITELGYIDDAAFARAWVESRHQFKGLSQRVLRRELNDRGVAAETIDEVLADGVDADSERAAAYGLAQKKLRAMGGLDRDTRVRRLVAMLGRKGYPSGLAFSVVYQVLQSAHDGRPDD